MTIPPRRIVPALLQVDAILGKLRGTDARTEVCRYLRQEFSHYRWVGIYRKEADTLVLDGWDGDQPTEHTRIPVARGICGQAVREARTVLVDDVRLAPEYLACFLETRAEIVVPIRCERDVVGEIDVDGDEVRAFDGSDQQLLEGVAMKLGPLFAPTLAMASPGDSSDP